MNTDLTRRGILGALTASTVAACKPAISESFSANRRMATGLFSHGIASGDPLQTAVILWTRLTPDDPTGGSINVRWDMAEQSDFAAISASGTFDTSAARNWTVKIDVQGLEAGQNYYYRFRVGDMSSPIGQTKTLPEGSVDKARFAIVSCANWQHGFFNAYDHISRQDHFDAFIHLGDYYYEYAADDYLDEAASGTGRLHEPRHEIITLEDYRLRHAQYRTDAGLQGITAKMPMIAIWDDHESSNDSWTGGAENHQEGEGDWDARRQAALRAYYEWMPIREPRPGRVRSDIFRSYDYGDLLTLLTVETRLTARAKPIIVEDHFDDIQAKGSADDFQNNVLRDPAREMFGPTQSEFIIETLKTSKAEGKAWRLMANQVIMGRLLTTDMTPYVTEEAMVAVEKAWAGIRDFVGLSKYNMPVYPDSWDGYPIARENFYARLIKEGVNDLLVVTGDAHEFWVNDLTSEAGEKVGLELVTSSVSSQTLTAFLGEGTADYNLLLTQSNPDALYYNALHNGYIDLTLGRTKGQIKMIGIDTVVKTDYEAFTVAEFTLRKSGNTIKATSPKGLNLKQRALFSGLG